jgi:hypothetical protein
MMASRTRAIGNRMLIMSGMSQFDSGQRDTASSSLDVSTEAGARMFNIVKHRDFMLGPELTDSEPAKRVRRAN